MNHGDDGTFTGILGEYGYLKLVRVWGSDQGIIEAARMSTDGGFKGWGDGIVRCTKCFQRQDGKDDLRVGAFGMERIAACMAGGHEFKATTGDEKLLAYLWKHKHATPFEMAGLQIEVEAPIFVFREWHRHRTQSYNEMSGRYIQLPDRSYVPTVERILQVNHAGKNKQAQGTVAHELTETEADRAQDAIREAQACSRQVYEALLAMGVAKEVARVVLPVGQFSRMRAQATLRNWLAFLDLRTAEDAQWEIRCYAAAVETLIHDYFPRTHAVWSGAQS